MMDPAVEKWFGRNEMQDLIPVFASQKLYTFHPLKSLTNDLVREIIPTIGVRINFMQKIETLKADSPSPTDHSVWNSEDVPSVDHSTPTFSSSSPLKRVAEDQTPVSRKRVKRSGIKVPTHILSQQALEQIRNLDFKKLLSEDVYTSHILSSFESTGELDNSDRGYIVTVAAKFLLNLSLNRITSVEYDCMAKKIKEVFPHETISLYFYSPEVKGKNAGGKLPDKVKNIRTALNKRGSAARNILTTTTSVVRGSEPTLRALLPEVDEDELAQALSSLQHTSLDSLPEILNLWSATHAHRRQILEDRTKCFQLSDWDVLHSPTGHHLLCQDFKELFPGREDLLISKWVKVKGNIISLVRRETPKTDVTTLGLLEALDTTPDSHGQSDPIVISLLASLCCKRGRGNCATTSNASSPATARDAFLLHIKTPNDMTRQVQNHMATLYKDKLLFQPIIIFVGPSLSEISASYVQIEDVRYHLRTPLAALDLCFKSFFALDMKYACYAYPVWLFIQRFFFNIVTAADESCVRVTSVISSLDGALARKSI